MRRKDGWARSCDRAHLQIQYDKPLSASIAREPAS